MQASNSLRLAPYDAQGGERSCTHRRWQANREDETWRRVLEDLDQLGISGDVAANRRECLAERAHPDVDPPRINAAMLGETASARAEHSGPVSIVDHQPGTILFLDLDDACQVGYVSFCRIKPLDYDETVSIFRSLIAQNSFKLVQPVVMERTSRRARQSYANHGTVVHKLIMNDQIAVGHYRSNGRHIGRMSANEYHRSIHAEEIGDFLFQVTVYRCVT